MDYLALTQARCSSTRFPNKVLTDLSGKPEILRVVERVKRSRFINDIIVVTSIDKSNLPLIEICAVNKIRVFTGSEDDVLDRFYQCARLFMPKYIVRVTADCPVFDWRYLDMAIGLIEKHGGIDYLSDFGETLPDGLDIEIISFSALASAWENARLSSEREHVTLYIRNNPLMFSILDFKCPIDNISHHRWTLDEKEDFVLLKKIYEHFTAAGKDNFVTEDILEYLAENPKLLEINSKYARNEGLAKSLENDRVVKISGA